MGFMRTVGSDIISGIGNLISPLSSMLTSVLNTVQAVPNLFSGFVSSVSGFFSSIQSAISSIGSTLSGMISGITNAISSIGASIQSAIRGVVSSLQSIGQSITNTLSGAISNITSHIQSFASSIGSAISSIISQIQSFGANLLSALSSGFEALKGAFSNIVEKVSSVLSQIQNIISDIGSKIYSAFSQVREVISNIGSAISSVASQIVSGIVSLGERIWNGIMGVKDWLVGGFKTIASTITQFITSLPNFFERIHEILRNIWGALVDAVKTIPERVKNLWDGVVNFFREQYNNILSGVNETKITLTGFINPLINIWNLLKGFFDFIINSFKKAPEFFEGAAHFLTKTIPDFFKDVKNFFTITIPEFFKDAKEFITVRIPEFFKDVKEFITVKIPEFFGDVKNFFTKTIPEKFNTLIESIKNFPKTLSVSFSSFIDFFKNIPTKLSEFVEAFKEKISSLISYAWEHIKGFGEMIAEELGKLGSRILNALVSVSQFILNTLFQISQKIVGGIKELGVKVGEFFKGIIFPPIIPCASAMVIPPLEGHAESAKPYLDSGNIEQYVKSLGEIGKLMGLTLTGFIGGQIAVRALSWMLAAASNTVERFLINVEGRLQPLGIGSIAGFRLSTAVGRTLKDLSFELRDWFRELYRGLVYGMAIWTWQPISKFLMKDLRNVLPLTLPSLEMIVEMLRRTLPSEIKTQIYNRAKYYLSMYGYSDEVLSWIATPIEELEKGRVVTIRDRFGNTVSLPISMMYDLPSVSELARMMVHDIFLTFDDFKKAIGMKGIKEDLAFMYYLLHFKYISPERLWEFYSRAKAGMLWYEKTMKVNADAWLKDALPSYMKWHDYYDQSWFPQHPEFPSDRDIAIELMADIPMRIDARWMYKWGQITDDELRRIVIARGMHPNWVDKITKAEAMNALSEERTYARTGVLNVFERGFLTKESANEILSNMINVKILDSEEPVKFLEGERQLLLFRGTYDRGYKIIDTAWDALVIGLYENIYSNDQVVSELTKIIERVNQTLGLKLKVDDAFIKSWLAGYDYKKDVWKVNRIRAWLRTFVWRIGDLAQSGMNIDKMVDDYAEKAHLTNEEKELIKEIAYMFRDGYIRDLKISAILTKLRRGEITRDKAIEELKGLVEYPELIDALIDKNFIDIVREYTLSISTLLSYATIISIPEEFIKKRLEALHVPPEDANIILQVFKIKPIKDEMALIARKAMDEFEEGYLTEEQLRATLSQLFKKPAEIELLVGASKQEKNIKKAKLITKAILNRLKRGAYTIDQAKTELLKIIKDEEYVNALIEAEGKIRTVSTDKLVSMMEYIPISLEKLKAKMDAEGVPPDEQQLYIPYIVATEVSEEIGKLVTELITDYVEGAITRDQFINALNDAATLGGHAKEWLGVDWIVLSPTERRILIWLADLRKNRRMMKLGRRS